MVNFYKSREWKDKRVKILERDNHECQMCKAKGKYSRANTVHHIVELKEKPQLALVESNLISLCRECHNRIHPDKFPKTKKAKYADEKW